MSFPGSLARDRRFGLLLLTSALAVVLGFFTFSADVSMRLIIGGGYWAMIVIFGLWVWSMVRIARQSWTGLAGWRTAPRWPAVLIAVCGVVLLVHESYGFKILMDEPMLLGTSMSMHFDKAALVPMRAADIQGGFQILAGQLDKRPLFQPFLVSLLHDFFGYRPENVFVLNTALTFVLLGLAYRTGQKLLGRAAGALAVLLLTSLPLLAQNATGGGFEVLNLVMILTTLLLGLRFAEKRDADSQQAVVLSAVLLAETRYESVLFILPVVLLIGWVWWREQRPLFSAVLLAAPLLLVPYALHNKVFSARESSWEMMSKKNAAITTPFSPRYISDNIAHGLNFFFDTSGQQSNSLVIAVFGFLAAPFFLLWVVKVLRRARTESAARVAFAIFALGFVAHTLLLLCYFWGQFDDPVIRRLSLPLNLALVLGIIVVAAEFRRPLIYKILAGLTIAGTFAYALPAMARHDYSAEYYVGREAEWRREFIAAHPTKDYLFIDQDSVFWIAHLISATPVQQALIRKRDLIYHFLNHTFSAYYVFQRFDVDDTTGKLTVQPADDLGPDYKLETVWERRFVAMTISRISRVTAIAPGPVTEPVRPPPAIETLSAAEQEKIRQAYFEKFVQTMP